MNPQALSAAMQTLTASVTGLRQAIIASNAGAGGATQSQGGRDALGSMWDMVANKFKAVLSPLALLGQTLNSTTSGFGVLQKAAQVLAASLGPILLPVTTLLATGLVALSTVLESALLPGMEGFIGFVLGVGIPALVALIDAVDTITKQLIEWARDVGSYSDGRRNTQVYEDILDEELAKLKAEGFEADTAWWKPQRYERFEEADRRALARMSAGEGAGGPPEASGTSKIVLDALKDVVSSFELSVGPRAQIGGLEGIGRGVQLAALNQDPLEARMLRTQQAIAEMLRKVVSRLENGSSPFAVGGGDF